MATYSEIIALIDIAIANMLSDGGAQSLSIGGKSVTYHSPESLMSLRKTYQKLLDHSSSTSIPFKPYVIKPIGIH